MSSSVSPSVPNAQGGSEPNVSHVTVRVRALNASHRPLLRAHFLALDDQDRHLRFGALMRDELVIQYVDKLNFIRDDIFGVFDASLSLVGVGHLAIPENSNEAQSTNRGTVAEFGVSVSSTARGMGVGSKLFERAAIHCRNLGICTLFMQCLSTNRVMMHIATKAGMEIHREYGESEAYLKLKPADSMTLWQETVEEQVAGLDYLMKMNAHVASSWWEKFKIGKAG